MWFFSIRSVFSVKNGGDLIEYVQFDWWGTHAGTPKIQTRERKKFFELAALCRLPAWGRGHRTIRPGGWRRQYGGTLVQKRSTANGAASARYWSAPSLPFYGIICQRALMDCSLKTSSSPHELRQGHLLFFFKAGKYAWKKGAHNELKTFMEWNHKFLYR